MSFSSVTSVMQARKSVRSFSNKPVPKDLVEEILELALLSPSGSNLQPWSIYALAGDRKDQLSKAVIQQAMSGIPHENVDIPIYPDKLETQWNDKRKACAEVMYAALDIPRDQKADRIKQVLKNYEFFGAPVGLIITLDRRLCDSQLMDIGILLQSIMMLAKERGLDTCAQAIWSMWPETVRDVLDIDANEMVVVGASLGYANSDAPVNSITQARMTAQDCVRYLGF